LKNPAGLLAAAVLVAIAVVLGPGVGSGTPPAEPPFPETPYSAMKTLLEKTVFDVNVLTLEVKVDPATAERLERAAAGKPFSEEVASEVARIVLTGNEAWVRMTFHRGASQEQFLRGIRENMKRALAAGWITEEHFEDVSENLPRWYDFLADRGVKKGDRVLYWIHDRRLETAFRGVDGKVYLDTDEEDPQAREGVLGSFFAPGSDFRKGLVRSLLRAG
jgi:hypothetical protein